MEQFLTEIENSDDDTEYLEDLVQQLPDEAIECKDRNGQSLIHRVAHFESHAVRVLSLLLKRFGSECLTHANSRGDTAIHIAAQYQDSECLEWIEQRLGSSCWMKCGFRGRLPVHYAAMNVKNTSSMQYLLQKLGKSCLTIGDERNESAIHLAARYQPSHSMLELIDQKATSKAIWNHVGFDGRRAVHYAGMNSASHQPILFLLKKIGALQICLQDSKEQSVLHYCLAYQPPELLNYVSEQWSMWKTAWKQVGAHGYQNVHYAALNSSHCQSALQLMVRILGKDCLKAKTNSGHTAVHLVARFQPASSLQFIEQLLGSCCWQLKGSQGRLPIHYAAMNEEGNSALQYLVNSEGLQCLSDCDGNGVTVLHYCAAFQSLESLEFFEDEEEKWRLKLRDFSGRSVVHFAAANENFCMQLLPFLVQQLGANCLCDCDNSNTTPVHIAAAFLTEPALNFIHSILNDQCWHLKDCHGRTPIHYAAMNAHCQQLLLLIVRYLSAEYLMLADKCGITALHLMAQHQPIECLEFVENLLGEDCWQIRDKKLRLPMDFVSPEDESRESKLRFLLARQRQVVEAGVISTGKANTMQSFEFLIEMLKRNNQQTNSLLDLMMHNFKNILKLTDLQ